MTTSNELQEKIKELQYKLGLPYCITVNSNVSSEEWDELFNDDGQSVMECEPSNFGDLDIDTNPSDDLDQFIFEFLIVQYDLLKNGKPCFLEPYLFKMKNDNTWFLADLI